MTILFSRYAKRRLKLYHIDESDVIGAIKRNAFLNKGISGKFIFVDEQSTKKFKYPLKVVATIDGSAVTIITVYPLKKGSRP